MALYAKRTKEDLVTERKMLLRRGFRFEEPLSLTIFECDTNIVVGHICGILYFSDVLEQTLWKQVAGVKSIMSDDLTRLVFEREYFLTDDDWESKRNVLVLHDPALVSDDIFIEEMLDQVRAFVEWYYSVEIDAVYQKITDMRAIRFANGLVTRYICRNEIENGLLLYEYENDDSIGSEFYKKALLNYDSDDNIN